MPTYAGIPLVLPTPELESLVAATLPPREIHRPLWAERARPLRVGSLYWPVGASSWAEGWYFATSEQLDAIRKQVYQPVYSPADLVLSDGTRLVATRLWMLTPKPIVGHEGVWLVPLVDDRYWWWLRTSGNLSIASGTTWENEIEQLAALLGVDIEHDDIPNQYLKAGGSVSGVYDPLPPLIDRLAAATGTRLVRYLDGRVRLQRPDRARQAVSQQLQQIRPVMAGGGLRIEAVEGNDQAGHFPKAVRITFPKKVDSVPSRDRIVMTATLTSLGISGLGRQVHDETVTVHSSAVATYTGSVLTNRAELAALARQIAQDWYAWKRVSHDYCFAGIATWQPDGFSEIQWHTSSGECFTRVRTPDPDITYRLELEHSSTSGGSGGLVQYLYTSYVLHNNTTEYFQNTTSYWYNNTVNYDTTTLNLNTSTINQVGTTTNYSTGTTINFNTGSTTNFNASSTVVFAGPAVSVTNSQTWAITTGQTWTVGGPGLFLINAPVSFGGRFEWSYHDVGTWSANQNDWAQPSSEKIIYLLHTDQANVDLTGIIKEADKQVLCLAVADTGGTITLKHDSASSSSSNRFYLPNAADLVLDNNDSALMWYDPTDSRWRLIGHTKASAGSLSGSGTNGQVTKWTGTSTLGSFSAAKGDLLAGKTDTTWDKLAAGTDGHVLTLDSTQTLGVKWAAVSGGTPPGDVRGDAQLGSGYSVGTSWGNSGLSVTLPGTGTYLLLCNVCGEIDTNSAGDRIEARLYDATNSAAVSNTTREVVYLSQASVEQAGSTMIHGLLTVSGSTTVRLEAQRISTGLVNKANIKPTYTVLTYVKIDD